MLFVAGSPDNVLYGVTEFGGDKDSGTVWKYDLTTHTESVVHSFGKPDGRDGSHPIAGLIQQGPFLYGTTLLGGGGSGTLYRIDIATGQETILYRFPGRPGFQNPEGSLLYHGGMLYLVASGGGSSDVGGVVQCTLAGNCTTIYNFAGNNDGSSPLAGVIYHEVTIDGVRQPALFGTTMAGGAAGFGTVYMLPLSGGATDIILHSFTGGSDGAHPQTELLASGSYLYGSTISGGENCTQEGGCGTVFRIAPSGADYKVTYAFAGYAGPPAFDGSFPSGALITDGNLLYGATLGGGAVAADGCPQGCGTVFSLDASGTPETVVTNFTGGAKGAFPENVTFSNGTLYGVTGGNYRKHKKYYSPSVLFSVP